MASIRAVCVFGLMLVAGVAAQNTTTVAQSQFSPYAWACAGTAGKLRGCAESQCNPIQANIGGMVLVLSTGSMMRAATGAEPQGATPSECCNLCKSTDLCNAWVFCNRKEGCGSAGSCTAYINALSPISATNSMRGLTPAASFGRFGAGCNRDGSWPMGTCSLKQVGDVVNPPVFGTGEAAEGWIAGITPKPVSSVKGCPVGLTEATCKACAATRNLQLCHSCMQSSVAWQASAAQCVPCANGGRCFR